MNFKVKIAVMLAILMAGVIFYLGLGKVITHFFDPELLTKEIKKQNGLEVKIENPRLRTRLNLWLYFDNLTVSTPDKEILRLEKSRLALKISPLVRKKISIKEFLSDGVRVDIYRDKMGKFEIEKYFNTKNNLDFEFELKDTKISLKDYEINLVDDCEKINTTFKGDYFDIFSTKNLFELKTRGTDGKGQYDLDLKTKLPVKKHIADSDFKFNVDVKNFDISPYSGYLDENIAGIFNVKIDTDGDKINADMKIDKFSMNGDKFDIKSPSTIEIASLAHVRGDSVEFEKLNVSNKDFDLNVNGKVTNYKSDDPLLNLNIEIKDAVLKTLCALLPNSIETPEDSIRKLKKYAADGIANGKIVISGNSKKPYIKGRVDVKEITLLNKLLKIPPSHGYVEFLSDKIYINARALLAPQKYVDVIGTVEFYGKGEGDFHIISQKAMPLDKVEILLLPIRDIVGFKLGPVPYMDIKGFGAIDLKTKGNKDKAALNGYFEFNDVVATIEGIKIPLSKGVGKVSFKGEKITFNDIKAKLYGADLKIDGNADILGNMQMTLASKNLSNKDIYEVLKNYLNPEALSNFSLLEATKFITAFNFGFKTKFDDNFDGLDLNKLHFFGSMSGVNSPNSDIVFNSGVMNLKGDKVFVNKLDLTYLGANVLFDLAVDKALSKPVANGKISLKSFPLEKLNEQKFNSVKILNNFKDYQGQINGYVDIVKNNISAKLALDGISAVDKTKNLPLKINSGNVEIKNNKFTMDALNINYGSIPVYFSARIDDITGKKPFIDARFSTSLAEGDVDKIINANLLYPIKVKGEVSLRGMLKGYQDNYNIYSTIKLNPQSDISYMGANFGDMDLRREVKTSINFKGNVAKVNNFEYLRYVNSQNNKATPQSMLRAFGEVVMEGNKAKLRNFNIKTTSATTARIFNVMFRKSLLKQGQFNCDLVLNGYYDDLKMLGTIDFTDIDIPLYNSKIRDAQLDFTPSVIYTNLAGKGFESDVKTVAQIQNNLKFPVVIKKIDINSSKINIGKIIDDLSALSNAKTGTIFNSKEQIIFSPKDLIIEDGEFHATEVNLYDINAKNLSSKFSHTSGSGLKFYDTIFDIAGGKIVSDGNFDFETTKLSLNSKIQNCEANALSQNFLGISGQLYGIANGEIALTGSQLHTAQGLKTVAAQAKFNVKNGKMPRLGSLEYLLRAGNIYKSGILGLSLNSIIEVLIPYKTGEFDSIKGNMLVKSGVIEKLEIFSKGENLSVFVHGKYDLNNDAADIEVLGRLSKKVSNLLGPIGNASFNSLINILSGQKGSKISENELVQNINKIPLIEISGEDYRIFQVKIIGDLNKEGYVKTFNWLN